MAPTVDDVYAVLVEKTTDKPYLANHVWTWQSMVDLARRALRSTTPAIESRMKQLVEDGRLRSVAVSYNGLVFWRGEDRSGLASAYLNPYRPHKYSQLEHGEVVSECPPGRDNLWANGEIPFYIVDTEYAVLVEKFREVRVQQKADAEEKRKAEKSQIREILRSASPQGDGIELIRALQKAMPESRVDVRILDRDSDLNRIPSFHMSVLVDPADLEKFLSVIRPGLVLSEFAEKSKVASEGKKQDKVIPEQRS